MINITEIAFTVYPVSDIARARDFYQNLLGLPPSGIDDEIEGMPGKYWIEYEVGNANIRHLQRLEPSGQAGPSVAFEVSDLEAAVAKLKEAGVRFVAENIDSPVCSFALITDPDGNGITIHKRKPSADQ